VVNLSKVLTCSCTGPYWIDPNGGCEKDAVEVWCDFDDENYCKTCIEPKRNVGGVLHEVEGIFVCVFATEGLS